MIIDLENKPGKKESINHPSHYNSGSIECIDYLEDQRFGFHAGNAIKYIARYRHKNSPVEDLRKAAWYCLRLAERIEATGVVE